MSENKSLRVLFFLSHLGGGGAEMNAVRLASYLAKSEVTVYFAVSRSGGAYAKFLADDVQVFNLPTGTSGSSTYRLIKSVKPLARLINKLKPDLVCSILPLPSVAALMTRSMVNQSKARFVVLIQNSLAGLTNSRLDLWGKCQVTLIKHFFPKADHLVAISRGVKKELQSLMPEQENKMSVIYNIGMPDEGEADVVSTCDESEHRYLEILACGRLVEQKDYPNLLTAISMLEQSKPFRLRILGEGTLRKQLEDMAHKLSISKNVEFLGFRENPLDFMRNCDIFVLSSRWEGFGNVIVEAMAMGAAVIATDCNHGPGEILTTEVNGILVEPANSVKLSSSIKRLIDDKSLRHELARKGHERAKDFSSDVIGRDYLRLFHHLCAS